jgi:hypothetical protein
VAYLSQDAVRSLETGDNGRMLLATVQGSGASTYQTLVIADPQLPEHPVTWSGRCSCPMQADCKHVVAVLLKARQQLAASERAAVPAWEAKLAELVRDVREVDRVPLGLQVEVYTRKPTRYAYSSDPVTELRLRPVIPGKAGGWVKTGASWYELEFGYSVSAVEPQHRDAVLALLTLWRTRQGAYASSYADPQVHIGAIGPRVWPALRAAVEAGVALVPVGKGGAPVHLADVPASVLLDLHQASPREDAELSAVVRMPGEPDRAPHDVSFVGEPVHGLYLAEPDRLLLAPLDRPLDEAAGRLLETGPVQIPAEALPRFVAVYYPGPAPAADRGLDRRQRAPARDPAAGAGAARALR